MRETTVFRPDSIQALVKALQAGSSKPTLIAGGTDLVIKLQKRTSEPEQLIVLGDVPEMKVISEHAKWMWIGASVRISELEKKKYPLELLALRDAASEIGSVQIRNIATIGGNIANASPSADFQPVLMALAADAQVQGKPHWEIVRLFLDSRSRSGMTDQPFQFIRNRVIGRK